MGNLIVLTYTLHNVFHLPDHHISSKDAWSHLADDWVDTVAVSHLWSSPCCHCPWRECYLHLWRVALLSVDRWELMMMRRLREMEIEVWHDYRTLSFHSHCRANLADYSVHYYSSIGSVRRCLPLSVSVMCCCDYLNYYDLYCCHYCCYCYLCCYYYYCNSIDWCRA